MTDEPARVGWITTYYEQGMEGYVMYVFQEGPESADGTWPIDKMFALSPGSELTIVGDDGAILWSGTLVLRRLGLFGLFGRRALIPRGIDPESWRSWFERRPPLTARYRSAPASS
jgi:hypothetical protein